MLEEVPEFEMEMNLQHNMHFDIAHTTIQNLYFFIWMHKTSKKCQLQVFSSCYFSKFPRKTILQSYHMTFRNSSSRKSHTKISLLIKSFHQLKKKCSEEIISFTTIFFKMSKYLNPNLSKNLFFFQQQSTLVN